MCVCGCVGGGAVVNMCVYHYYQCVVGDCVWLRRHSTSSVRPITPHLISYPSAAGLQTDAASDERGRRWRMHPRFDILYPGSGKWSCRWRFVEVSGRIKQEAVAGVQGDVLIRSGLYGTNTTGGEQESRRGER